MAPGTRENYARQIVGRDGTERRRFMATRVDIKGLTKLPTWSCDPVTARNDADRPHTRHAVVDLGIPEELRWVDASVARLARQFPIRAAVLREEFCGVGTQGMKTARVAAKYGGQLSVRQYRYELQLALEWMRMQAFAA